MISCCFGLPVQETDNRQPHEKEKDYKEVKAEVTVTGVWLLPEQTVFPQSDSGRWGLCCEVFTQAKIGETGLALQQD